MSPARRWLCAAYGLLAVVALIGTWSHNLAYLGGGFIAANQRFWLDTLVTPASTSITVDIIVLAAAVNLWMVLEARRLRIAYVWLYVVAGALVAISVSFPLFMIHRERRLAQRGEAAQPLALTRGDLVGLLLLGLLSIGFALRQLPH